jgi:hypothetical protein
VNEERISGKILNLKVKGECARRRLRSEWEQQLRKDVTWKEVRPLEEIEEEMESWLSDDPLSLKLSEEEEEVRGNL